MFDIFAIDNINERSDFSIILFHVIFILLY